VGLKSIVDACLLVTVTDAEEVCPAAVLGKVRLVGLNVSGINPVPVSFTSCGLVLALSVKVSAPVIAETMVGLKVTFTVQLLLAGREVEQLLLSVKSPLAVMEPISSAADPELVSVTDFDELVVPAATLPKARVFWLMPAVPPVGISTKKGVAT